MPVFTSSIEVTADYPTIKPSLNLNFARSRSLDPRITFTRASVGTYVGRDGLIKTAGEDEARFDHDPETLESLGLLIEESRTNLFTNSAFSQNTTTSLPSYWDGFNPATFLTSQTLSPDGVAYGMFHGAINQNGGGLRKNVTGLTPGGTYYVTYYVKGLTTEELTYFTNNNARGTTTGTADGAANVAWFAATQVQFSCANLNGTGASGSYQTTLTTEWKRFGGVITADDAGSARIVIGNNVSDVGTGNEDGGGTWMIWGAQLELGSFPTSYIPTSPLAATRAADEGNITGDAFSSFYNTTEGVLQTEFSRIGSVYNQMVVQFKDSDGSERIEIRGQAGSDDSFRMEVIEGGATAAQEYAFSSGAVVANVVGQFAKVNLAYKQNDFASTINGTLASIDNAGDVGVCDRVGIGYANYGIGYNGHIKNIIYYPKRLTNTQLQLLTS
jgi:hypothetical protein